MKVLLVDPPHLFLEGKGLARQIHPLGLGYVASSLAREHDVRMLLPDQRAWRGDDPWAELDAALLQEAPEVLGVSLLTANLPATRELVRRARCLFPDLLIVAGGVHPTILPRETLAACPEIDFAVRGEGEIAALELLRGVEARRRGLPFDPRSVAGLAWREPDGSVALAPTRPPNRDLDALPWPQREGLVWPDDVLPAFYQGLITVRGCPYDCLYCAIPRFNDRRIRTRSPADVAGEIAHLKERHGADYLFFHDPVFTVSRKRVFALCDELVRRDLVLPHCIQTRPENVDAELLDAMRGAGLHTLFFGIESGSPETLRRMNRHMGLDRIREAVRLSRERGIRTGGFFMVGLPWEVEADMRLTQDFARDLDLDMLVLSSCSPFPGTALWDEVAHPMLPESIDFRIPQVNLTGLDESAYKAVFAEIRGSFDEYNRARVFGSRLQA